MAKLTLTVTNVCAGGNHLTVVATLGDFAPMTFMVDTDECAIPPTAEEMLPLVKFIMRSFSEGKAASVFKDGFQTGLTMTLPK